MTARSLSSQVEHCGRNSRTGSQRESQTVALFTEGNVPLEGHVGKMG